MSQLNKQDLKAENQLQFPNNNNGAITPANLRAFNVDMIDSTVNQTAFDSFSGSVSSQLLTIEGEITALENFSASLSGGFVTEGELAAATQSLINQINTKVDTTTFNSYTQSNDDKWNTLGAQTGSFATAAITASSLITASFDNGTRNLTFTKGDASTFAVNISDVSGSTINTASFATTGSNTFVGIQNFTNDITASNAVFNGDVIITPNTATQLNGNTNIGEFLYINSGLTLNTGAAIQWVSGTGSIDENFSASVDARINAITGSGGTIDTGSFATTGSNTFRGDQNISGSIFFPNGTEIRGNASQQTVFNSPVSSLLISCSVNSIIAASDLTLNASRTYVRGVQTINDVAGTSAGEVYLLARSGSLVLSNAVSGPAYSSLSHISSSQPNANTNLIFKTNNNTADTIISGSGNIWTNFSSPLAGFKKYIGGSNNIINNTAGGINLTGSVTYSPQMANNIFNGALAAVNMRIPTTPVVNSVGNSGNFFVFNNILNQTVSLGTTAPNHFERAVSGSNINNNIINGALALVANKTDLTTPVGVGSSLIGGGTVTANLNSSSVNIANIQSQGTLTINNDYYNSTAVAGGSGSFNSVGISAGFTNLGNNNTLYFSGSNTSITQQRLLLHGSIIGHQNQLSANQNGDNSHLMSANLIGSGLALTGSSTFATPGAVNNTAGTVVVGRYNQQGMLSGPTVFAVGTGISTARKTGFLIDSGSNSFFEGTVNVSGSTSLSGSLTIQSGSSFFANGNKQFNVGAFSSLVTQSGSAGVSQSVNFEVTDKSEGITIASNSQITIANSGTYSLTFSAQIKADGGQDTIWMWLKKNGTNVDNTATKLIAKNGEESVMTVNYVVDAAANDYYEIVWENLNGYADLLYEGATGNIPTIPSVILTAVQVR